jgi:hypothetical protein
MDGITLFPLAHVDAKVRNKGVHTLSDSIMACRKYGTKPQTEYTARSQGKNTRALLMDRMT